MKEKRIHAEVGESKKVWEAPKMTELKVSETRSGQTNDAFESDQYPNNISF